MVTKTRLIVATVVVAAALAWSGSAMPPDGERYSGKVLLLANERALEGEIERVEDRYCVRRGKGEMWLPVAKTLRLCADWDEALTFLKGRANLQDADERLRLARWCQSNDQTELALAEVRAALELRPNHRPAQLMQAVLQKALAAANRQATEPTPAPVAAPPLVDVSAESLALFNAKVQPILMNTCARCHLSGETGFQLARVSEGGHRAATQRNLAAALAYVNMERPIVSPLLIKALSAHGNAAQAPLAGGRQGTPYRALDEWVRLVVENNPHLREQFAKSEPTPPPSREARPMPPVSSPTPRPLPLPLREVTPNDKAPMLPPAVRPVEHLVSPTAAGAGPADVRTVPVNPQPPGPQSPTPRPFNPATPTASSTTPAAEEPIDPYDPDVFNRRMHPKQ